MWFLARAFAFFTLTAILSACAHRDRKICGNVTLREGSIELSRNEEVLVCGSDRGKEGWRDVPLPQAEYQLKVLFQQRGYYEPRFEREKDQLRVWSGPRKKISELIVHDSTDIVDADRKRKIVGETLTPEKLDEVETWAETGLRSHGYPCPEIGLQAQAWDGKIVANVQSGKRLRILEVDESGLGTLDEVAMARYRAFEVGDLYDVRETQLTASRMLGNGLFQSAYFVAQCRDDGAYLKLKADVGPSRLLRFEIGASTEEFPFTNIWFKNARLDDRASSLTAVVRASPLRQKLSVSSELFVIPGSKRTYFGPRFEVGRTSENDYEYLQAKLGADLGRSFDWDDMWISARGGPTLNYVNTTRGTGPDDVSYLSWEASVAAMDHRYEMSLRDQYEGWQASFEYRGQRDGLGSEINVDRYETSFKYLWNVGAFAPPLVVFATRLELVGVAANAVDEGAGRDLLPQEYRVYYGGDQNLRGFGRQALSNNAAGYLTAAYVGFEARLIEELRWRMEPFLLWDMAKLGNERFNLDDPVFASWGGGLRWASPFGTLRGSVAKGEIFDADLTTRFYTREWVFFMSFGQEF